MVFHQLSCAIWGLKNKLLTVREICDAVHKLGSVFGESVVFLAEANEAGNSVHGTIREEWECILGYRCLESPIATLGVRVSREIALDMHHDDCLNSFTPQGWRKRSERSVVLEASGW